MSDPPDEQEQGGPEAGDAAATSAADAGQDREPVGSDPGASESVAGEPEGAENDEQDLAALREQVEAEYDFDDFGPADMARMSGEEWEAAFDPESWITGGELLDRVEDELNQRVADREVFARLERRNDRILAYSDTGYATIYADGTVEGRGTVLRDVKPTVALCSMESYDPPEDPPEGTLPEPQEVPEGSGQLGNWMLQAVAGAQVLAGLVLVGAWLLMTVGLLTPPGGASVRSLNVIGMLVAGVLFVGIGIFLFTVVANARLSDRFRAEEYRNRLRAVDLEPGERPEVLPDEERAALEDRESEAAEQDATAGDAVESDAAETDAPRSDATRRDGTRREGTGPSEEDAPDAD
jgi:hypothetical protein